MTNRNKVILVDKNDKELGVCDKMEAHEKAKLHRAFSVFVFNSKGDLLLQRRAMCKYHSGGLWTNTVCSHPGPDEDIIFSAKKRLEEEMGFSTDIEKKFSFVYRSDYENGLSEHEFDHVFVGYYDTDPVPNPQEVMEYKWINMNELIIDVKSNPDKFTSWFKIILEKFIEEIR